MGRAIKKKWFTAYAGSVAGNLNVLVGGGSAEAIIKQVGTGVYQVASGRVKLSNPADPAYVEIAPDPMTGVVGTAVLNHNGRAVRRINQYRVTYFDDGDPSTPEDDVWRDGNATVLGTFDPALSAEGDEPGGPGEPAELPIIGGMIPNASGIVDSELTFSVVVTGADSLQWKSDEASSGTFADIPGATSGTLALTRAAPVSFSVRCTATSAAGSVDSNTATASWTVAAVASESDSSDEQEPKKRPKRF